MRAKRWAANFLRESRIAHLATSTQNGIPHIVPVCFVFDQERIYFSIDKKRKRVEPTRLKRVRNILENPHVALVADYYVDRDWAQLKYVMVIGTAQMVRSTTERSRAVSLLRGKYSQYRNMMIETMPIIRIKPSRIVAWKADTEH